MPLALYHEINDLPNYRTRHLISTRFMCSYHTYTLIDPFQLAHALRKSVRFCMWWRIRQHAPHNKTGNRSNRCAYIASNQPTASYIAKSLSRTAVIYSHHAKHAHALKRHSAQLIYTNSVLLLCEDTPAQHPPTRTKRTSQHEPQPGADSYNLRHALQLWRVAPQ